MKNQPVVTVIGIANRSKIFLSDYGGLVGAGSLREKTPLPANYTPWTVRYGGESGSIFYFTVVVDENGNLLANDANDPYYPNIPNKLREIDPMFDNDPHFWWKRMI